MTQPRGNFVWHELLTPNKESATAFYPRVAGWKTQAWEKAPSYTLWMGPRGPLGGLGTLSSAAGGSSAGGVPMGWLPFIEVPDTHRSVEQAKALGARILTDVSRTPAGGEWAVLADPQGAVFAVYASTGEEGAQSGSAVPSGEFSWHELATTDYKAALDFYSALFGWTLDRVHDMGEMGDYALFAVEGRQIGGMYNTAEHGDPRPSPHWLCYVQVDELESAVQNATGVGGRVLLGPMDVPGGSRIAVLTDPDGVRFALHQMPRTQTVRKKGRAAASPRPKARRTIAKATPEAAARKPAASAKRKTAKKKTKVARRKKSTTTRRKTVSGPSRRKVKQSGRRAPAKASRRSGSTKTRRSSVSQRSASRARKTVRRGRGTRKPARRGRSRR